MKSFFKISIVILFFAICVFLILNKEKSESNENNDLAIKEQAETKKFILLKIGGIELLSEVADNPQSREKGLSGRESMIENQGMLFIFDEAGNYPFWMPDMNFAIDIIWLDENKKIIFIKENATPESYPETWGGEVKAKYVLEVISGFSKKHNLKIGDSVVF